MHPSRTSALLLPALLAGCGLLEDRDSFRIISPFDATTRDVTDAARDARDASDVSDVSDAFDASDVFDASDGGMDADVSDGALDADVSDGALDADVSDARNDLGDVTEPRDRTEIEDATDAGPAVCRGDVDCPAGQACCGVTGRCYDPRCLACCMERPDAGVTDGSADAPDATEPCPTTMPPLRAPWSSAVVTSETVAFRAESSGPTRQLQIRLCPLTASSSGCTFLPLADVTGGTVSTQARISPGVYRWGIESRRSDCARPAGSIDWTFRVPPHTADATRTGVSTGLMTDFNRDGRSEIVAGAPFEGTAGMEAGPGAFYLIAYNAAGMASVARATFAPTADSPRNLGMTLSAAGDLNGDGFADLVVGGRIGATGAPTGVVRMYFGNGSSLNLMSSLEATRQVGYAITGLAGVGDVNLDGLGDFIASARNEASGSVNVLVFHGQLSAGIPTAPRAAFVSTPAPTPATFGQSLSAAGDLDGDAFADFAVGAPSGVTASADAGAATRGRAFVYFGATASAYDAPRELFVNGADASNNPPTFGAALANAGDFTGAGRSCVAVSSSVPPGGLTAFVHVFCLSTAAGPRTFLAPVTLTIPAIGGVSELGSVLTGVGDVNDDGLGDLALGSRANGGLVVLFGRRAGTTSALAQVLPEALGGGAGFAITGLGDVAGDSDDDLVVGHVASLLGITPETLFVYPGGGGFESSLRVTSPPILVPAPSRADGFGRYLATGR
ncbi:MAG: FG-GAP-like repeat-containing protein [Polyangiales bacterium]